MGMRLNAHGCHPCWCCEVVVLRPRFLCTVHWLCLPPVLKARWLRASDGNERRRALAAIESWAKARKEEVAA